MSNFSQSSANSPSRKGKKQKSGIQSLANFTGEGDEETSEDLEEVYNILDKGFS